MLLPPQGQRMQATGPSILQPSSSLQQNQPVQLKMQPAQLEMKAAQLKTQKSPRPPLVAFKISALMPPSMLKPPSTPRLKPTPQRVWPQPPMTLTSLTVHGLEIQRSMWVATPPSVAPLPLPPTPTQSMSAVAMSMQELGLRAAKASVTKTTQQHS